MNIAIARIEAIYIFDLNMRIDIIRNLFARLNRCESFDTFDVLRQWHIQCWISIEFHLPCESVCVCQL